MISFCTYAEQDDVRDGAKQDVYVLGTDQPVETLQIFMIIVLKS